MPEIRTEQENIAAYQLFSKMLKKHAGLPYIDMGGFSILSVLYHHGRDIRTPYEEVAVVYLGVPGNSELLFRMHKDGLIKTEKQGAAITQDGYRYFEETLSKIVQEWVEVEEFLQQQKLPDLPERLREGLFASLQNWRGMTRRQRRHYI